MRAQADLTRYRETHLQDAALALLFFVSGWSAILYELVWQRTLFATVGINIEAVTLIVTEFMLGLGIGSLLGGAFLALYVTDRSIGSPAWS